MGYVHRWKLELDIKFLPDPFFNDVKEVVIDFLAILKDVNVSKEIVRFNGQQGHGCDTFFFRPDHYHNWVKTGGFWVEPYDKPVCAVLLLAIYHFGDKIETHSDGLATLYVNTETEKAAPEWENAITYVEEKFGYFFDRSFYRDEYGQVHIKLEPVQNRNGIQKKEKEETRC